MSLQYIIDGYNIINHPQFTRRHKNTRGPGASLSAFIRTKRLTGSQKNKVVIVFDGYPSSGGLRDEGCGINLVFSRKISADEKIKKIVEESGNRKNIIVVSDDREIGFLVKSLGARSLGVEEFIGPKENCAAAQRKSPDFQELSYTQKNDINRELRKIWLGEG